MWSVGVLTYLMLSGLSPFKGDNDNETLKNITNVEWNFDHEAWRFITDDALDFIDRYDLFPFYYDCAIVVSLA